MGKYFIFGLFFFLMFKPQKWIILGLQTIHIKHVINNLDAWNQDQIMIGKFH